MADTSRIEDIEAQIARLQERKRDVQRKMAEEERKGRNHACMVLGGMMLACFPDGWASVDFKGLDGIIKKNASVFSAKRCEALPTAEASKRLREWEKSGTWPAKAEAQPEEPKGEPWPAEPAGE